MKKIAFCLLFITTAASAGSVKLDVGGYANWYAGYVDIDDDAASYNHVPVTADVTLNFKGKATLDNGLAVGAFIEISADGDGDPGSRYDNDDTFDQSYIFIDSKIGRVVLGQMDHISKQMYMGFKDAGPLGLDDSDMTKFIPDYMDDAAYIKMESKAPQITYIAPTVAGFTLGLSYIDDSSASQNGCDGFDKCTLSYTAAASYRETFSNVGFGISAAISKNEDDGGRSSPWKQEMSFGLSLSYMGFELGGGYKRSDYDDDSSSYDKTETVSFGLSYAIGPISASIGYLNVEDKAILPVREADQDLILLSVAYDIAEGIETFVSLGLVRFSDDYKEKQNAAALVTGLALNF